MSANSRSTSVVRSDQRKISRIYHSLIDHRNITVIRDASQLQALKNPRKKFKTSQQNIDNILISDEEFNYDQYEGDYHAFSSDMIEQFKIWNHLPGMESKTSELYKYFVTMMIENYSDLLESDFIISECDNLQPPYSSTSNQTETKTKPRKIILTLNKREVEQEEETKEVTYKTEKKQKVSHIAPLEMLSNQKNMIVMIEKLMKEKSAAPFLSPVDTNLAPGYLDIIKRPMDLSTIAGLVSSGKYAGDMSLFRSDMQLIWENCIAYNVPDSYISKKATKFSEVFEQVYLQVVGKNKSASSVNINPVTSSSSSSEDKDALKHSTQKSVDSMASLKQMKSGKDSQSLSKPVDFDATHSHSRSHTSALAAGTGEVSLPYTSKQIKAKLIEFITTLEENQEYEPFKYPVNLSATEGYAEMIAKPMDFLYLRKHIMEYTTGLSGIENFVNDFYLISSNCKAYNLEGSDIYNTATELHADGRKLLGELFPEIRNSSFLRKGMRGRRSGEGGSQKHREMATKSDIDSKHSMELEVGEDVKTKRAVGAPKKHLEVMEEVVPKRKGPEHTRDSGHAKSTSSKGDVAAVPVKSDAKKGKMSQKDKFSQMDSTALNALVQEISGDNGWRLEIIREKCFKNSSNLSVAITIPFAVESYEVLNFGMIEDNFELFHNRTNIFPINYKAKKRLKLHLMANENNKNIILKHQYLIVEFTNLVEKGGDGVPLFRVSIDDVLIGESSINPRIPWEGLFDEDPASLLKILGGNLRRCRAVLNRLCIHTDIYPFLEEISSTDAVGMAYYQEIKSPMWLREVHKRLLEGEYDNEFDFAWDVRLVFANCKAFNSPSSTLYVEAEEISALFESLFCSWVINVHDNSLHDLAKGPWDDWSHLRYFDGRDNICRQTGLAGNDKSLYFCTSCEDQYSSEGLKELEIHPPHRKNDKWVCKRCKLAQDTEKQDKILQQSPYSKQPFPSVCFQPSSNCSVESLKKLGLAGWFVAAPNKATKTAPLKFKCISPLGYECTSIDEVKEQIVKEGILDAELRRGRELEYQKSTETNKGPSSRESGKRRKKGRGNDDSSSAVQSYNGTAYDENWMTIGKIAVIENFTDFSFIWTEIGPNTSHLHIHPESGQITSESLSSTGYFGFEDLDIRRLVEGLPGVYERCPNYEFMDTTSTQEKTLHSILSIKKTKESHEKVMHKIEEETSFWKNLEYAHQQQLRGDNITGIVTALGDVDSSDMLATFMESINHQFLRYNYTHGDMVLAIQTSEMLYYGREMFGNYTIGLVEILMAMQPLEKPQLPSPGQVLFDELCILFVEVLISDMRTSVFGYEDIYDIQWQNFLAVHPINFTTYPLVLYELLHLKTNARYGKYIKSINETQRFGNILSHMCTSKQVCWDLICILLNHPYVFKLVQFMDIMQENDEKEDKEEDKAEDSEDEDSDRDGDKDNDMDVSDEEGSMPEKAVRVSMLAITTQLATSGFATLDSFVNTVETMWEDIARYDDSTPEILEMTRVVFLWFRDILMSYKIDGIIDISIIEKRKNHDSKGLLPASWVEVAHAIFAKTEISCGVADYLYGGSFVSSVEDDVHGDSECVKDKEEDEVKLERSQYLAVMLRILPQREIDVFSLQERKFLLQLCLMLVSECDAYKQLIEKQRGINLEKWVNQSNTDKEKMDADVKSFAQSFIGSLESANHVVKNTKSGNSYKCYFSGVEAKYSDPSSDWVFVPDMLMENPSFNKSEKKVIRDIVPTEDAVSREAIDDTCEEKDIVEEEHENAARRNTRKQSAQAGNAILSSRVDNFTSRAICLRNIAIDIAVARKQALLEWESNEVVVSPLSLVFRSKLNLYSSSHLSNPLGCDRFGREYYLLDSQQRNTLFGLSSSDKMKDIAHNPALLVSYDNRQKWGFVSYQNIHYFLSNLSSEYFCEISLKSHISKKIYALFASIDSNVLKVANEQKNWFLSYQTLESWLSQTKQYSHLSKRTNWWPTDNSEGEDIRLIELATLRCEECRLSCHYAFLNDQIGPKLLNAMSASYKEARQLNKEEREMYNKRAVIRNQLLGDTLDLHPDHGWLRIDTHSKIRSLYANTLATRLLAEPQIADAVFHFLKKTSLRPNSKETDSSRNITNQQYTGSSTSLALAQSSLRERKPLHLISRKHHVSEIIDVGDGMEEFIATTKPVEQLHILTDEVLRRYSSGSEAAHTMDISQSGISLCCLGKKYDFMAFKWRNVKGPVPKIDPIPVDILKQMKFSHKLNSYIMPPNINEYFASRHQGASTSIPIKQVDAANNSQETKVAPSRNSIVSSNVPLTSQTNAPRRYVSSKLHDIVSSTVVVSYRMIKLKVELLNMIAIFPENSLVWPFLNPPVASSVSEPVQTSAATALKTTAKDANNESIDRALDTDPTDEMEENISIPESNSDSAKSDNDEDVGIKEDGNGEGNGEEMDSVNYESDANDESKSVNGDMEGRKDGIDDGNKFGVKTITTRSGTKVVVAAKTLEPGRMSTKMIIEGIQLAKTPQQLLHLIIILENAIPAEGLRYYDKTFIPSKALTTATAAYRLFVLDRSLRYERLSLDLRHDGVDFLPRVDYSTRCMINPQCHRPVCHYSKCTINGDVGISRFSKIASKNSSASSSDVQRMEMAEKLLKQQQQIQQMQQLQQQQYQVQQQHHLQYGQLTSNMQFLVPGGSGMVPLVSGGHLMALPYIPQNSSFYNMNRQNNVRNPKRSRRNDEDDDDEDEDEEEFEDSSSEDDNSEDTIDGDDEQNGENQDIDVEYIQPYVPNADEITAMEWV